MNTEEKKVGKLLKKMFPKPEQSTKPKLAPKEPAGKLMKLLARKGTVTLRAGMSGFQLKGYHKQPPEPFDLRGPDPMKLLRAGLALQRKRGV